MWVWMWVCSGRECVRVGVCVKKREKVKEREWQREPLMYGHFWFGHLQVSLQGPICRVHLMLTPTLDSTICLRITKYRVEGNRSALSLFSSTHLRFHILCLPLLHPPVFLSPPSPCSSPTFYSSSVKLSPLQKENRSGQAPAPSRYCHWKIAKLSRYNRISPIHLLALHCRRSSEA